MPLNEIPRNFNPETRNLIEAALEDAWGIKQGRRSRSCTSTKQAENDHSGSRLCRRNRPQEAQVVRHSCLARSTTKRCNRRKHYTPG
jgi:hypothetical protein